MAEGTRFFTPAEVNPTPPRVRMERVRDAVNVEMLRAQAAGRRAVTVKQSIFPDDLRAAMFAELEEAGWHVDVTGPNAFGLTVTLTPKGPS